MELPKNMPTVEILNLAPEVQEVLVGCFKKTNYTI